MLKINTHLQFIFQCEIIIINYKIRIIYLNPADLINYMRKSFRKKNLILIFHNLKSKFTTTMKKKIKKMIKIILGML